MALSSSDRKRLTIGQMEKLEKTRDCPSCPGVLNRHEVYEEDRMLVERYWHMDGNADCAGNNPNNGFWREAGQYVIHYPDGSSEGGGILRGEFQN